MEMATWRKELLSEIRTIADMTELDRLWSGKDPRAISSYSEEVAHVFDDYDIDGFLSLQPQQVGLTPSQLHALKLFRDHFASYVDYVKAKYREPPNYQIHLADPKWIAVMSSARDFVAQIDEH